MGMVRCPVCFLDNDDHWGPPPSSSPRKWDLPWQRSLGTDELWLFFPWLISYYYWVVDYVFFFIMFIYFINVDDVAICFSVVSILPIQIHKWLTHYNQTISSGLRADPRSGFVSVSGCPWQALSNWDAKASSPWRWWHWWRWKSTWYILIYRLNKVSHWSS